MLLLRLLAGDISNRNNLPPYIFPFMYSFPVYSERRKEPTMSIAFLDSLLNRVTARTMPERLSHRRARRMRMSTTMATLFLVSALLLCASVATYSFRAALLAGSAGAAACTRYTVEPGDTLTNIAWRYHTTIWTLARANGIGNVNLIFVNQRLCIPSRGHRAASAGITANGTVRWYAYDALDWSDRVQVRNLLYQVAAIHYLPARLLLAIAWQESGWTQHVIAWDGGIGVMQLMPYTAMGINAGIGQQLDPYTLWDNLNLGATYLQWLWQSFHGNLTQVISAYNEGGWAVQHRGIFNWPYVNSVLALMDTLS